MTLTLRYLPAAIADLDSIWDYSAQTWGEDQADHYLMQLRDRANDLTDRPLLGADSSSVRPNFRRLRVGSHHIYYRPHPDIIEIVRVLHQRMDIGRADWPAA